MTWMDFYIFICSRTVIYDLANNTVSHQYLLPFRSIDIAKLRAQMLQLKIPHVAMKTPHLATKSQQTQIKKKKIIDLTLKKRTGITCSPPIPTPSPHTHHAGILLFC